MEARREKARGLLLQLLSPAQREEYVRYNSWRVWVRDDAGLPSHKIEIGIAVQGFIMFCPRGSPYQSRNVDMTACGSWCMEDRLIAIWLRFRREGTAFVLKCCTSPIRPRDVRRIMARTAHL